MTTSKVIDLEGLRKFKGLLDSSNAEKFAGKEQFEELVTTFEENYPVTTTEQVDSMFDEIFGDSYKIVVDNEEYHVSTEEQIDSMLDDIFG